MITLSHHKKTPIVSDLIEQYPDFLDLIMYFIESLPSLIGEVQRLQREGDWDILKDKVHDLKGIGGNYGYMQITDICNQIEQSIRLNKFKRVSSLISELTGISARICDGLDMVTAKAKLS